MKNRKMGRKKFVFVLILLFITIGFAYLTATLNLFGTSKLLGSNYSIHWDENSIEESGVTPSTSAYVVDADKKVIEFAVDLVIPGDYYEFTVDAVNDGDINGEIKSVKKEIYNADGEKINIPENIIYTLKYADNDEEPKEGEVLEKKTGRKKYKVRVGFNSEATEIPETDQAYTFKIEVVYEQSKKAATIDNPPAQSSVISIADGKTKDTLELGDEVCINGTTTECFNFIKYNGDNLVLLSKWNLNVGTNAVNYTETFIQDSGARGFTGSDFRGVVRFSTNNYWSGSGTYPVEIYDDINYLGGAGEDNYSVATYVKGYKNILEGEGYGATIASARLLKYDEITETIGCSTDNGCPTGFIRNTSFWLGTARDDSTIYVAYNGNFGYNSYSSSIICGVRPVIEIAKSSI